jgi:putative heme-binding domain-containing protein
MILLAVALPLGVQQAGEPKRSGLDALVRLLGQIDDPAIQLDILRGMHAALLGRRQVAMPPEWPGVYRKLARSPHAEVREKATLLAVLFGDEQALSLLRKVLVDPQAEPAARQSALQALLSRREDRLVPLLHGLLDDPAMRGPAIRALAAYAHPETPRAILKRYVALTAEERADAVQTLAARPEYALALLDAVERGTVARRDVSAFAVRQMQALGDPRVAEQLARVWGMIRPPSEERAAQLKRYKALLTEDYVKTADLANGRRLYKQHCAACHVLFGEGGKIGPELTGSQRQNLDYILENLIDPSAVVPRDYQVTILQTADGRLVTGIIQQESEQVVTVQTPNELLRLPRDEILARKQSPLSMMPEGLLAPLRDDEVRDLISYLASPAPVPLPQGR